MEITELKEQELVEALLLGSAEIDRMKEEINTLVGMMLGVFAINKAPTSCEVYCFRCGDHVWGLLGHPETARFRVQCYLHSSNRVVYNSAKGASEIHFWDVQDVRKTLPGFLDDIAGCFPELKLRKYWRPFLDAAAAAKERSQS